MRCAITVPGLILALACLGPALGQQESAPPLPPGWARRWVLMEVRADKSLAECTPPPEGHVPGVGRYSRSERTILLKDPRLDAIQALPEGARLSTTLTIQDGPRESRAMYAERIAIHTPRESQLEAPRAAEVVADRVPLLSPDGRKVQLLLATGTRLELLVCGSHGGDRSLVRLASPTGGWLLGRVRTGALRRHAVAPAAATDYDPRAIPDGFPRPEAEQWLAYTVARDAELRDLKGQPLAFLPAGSEVLLASRRGADRLVLVLGGSPADHDLGAMFGLLRQGDIVDGAGQDDQHRWTRPTHGINARLGGAR